MSEQTTGSLRIVGDALHIKSLVLQDAPTLDYIASHEDSQRLGALSNCVQLGARVLCYATDRLGTTEICEQIDASAAGVSKLLRAAGKATHETIERQMQSTFGKNGNLDSLLDAQMKRLQRDLEKQMDPQVASSILGKFRSEMKTDVTNLVGSVGKIFDVDEPGSVGHRLKTQIDENNKALSQQVQTVITQLAVKSAVGTERLKGTRKGMDFEDALEAVLAGWTRVRHDRLDRVTESAGLIPNCKSGDFVVEIAPRDAGGQGLRLAIEAKNDQTRHREAVRKVEEAIENRGAAVGLWVSTNAAIVPRGTPPICFLGNDKIFVHVTYEPDEGLDGTLIEVALEVARASAIVARQEGSVALDLSALGARITAAINATQRFTEIKKQLTGVSTSVEKIQTLVDDVRAEIRKALSELQGEVDRQLGCGEPHLRIA
jgi:hypothetical protein